MSADNNTPADAFACGALGCRRTQNLQAVTTDDGRERVLCPEHVRYFVEVSD